METSFLPSALSARERSRDDVERLLLETQTTGPECFELVERLEALRVKAGEIHGRVIQGRGIGDAFAGLHRIFPT